VTVELAAVYAALRERCELEHGDPRHELVAHLAGRTPAEVARAVNGLVAARAREVVVLWPGEGRVGRRGRGERPPPPSLGAARTGCPGFPPALRGLDTLRLVPSRKWVTHGPEPCVAARERGCSGLQTTLTSSNRHLQPGCGTHACRTQSCRTAATSFGAQGVAPVRQHRADRRGGAGGRHGMLVS